MIVKQYFYPFCESLQSLCTKLQNCHGLHSLNDAYQSVIGIFPKWLYIVLQPDQTLKQIRHGLTYEASMTQQSFKSCIKQTWGENKLNSNACCDAGSKLRFDGGLLGFVGYDLAASQFVSLKQIQAPAALMGEYDIFLRQEHNGWQLYGPDLAELIPVYNFIKNLLNDSVPQPSPTDLQILKAFRPVWHKAQYRLAFKQIQQYLQQGDCYQVNLTQPFVAQAEGSLLAAMDALLHLTKAAYAGYTKYEDFELLSCSPELFIEFGQQGEVITRPIKGTRPRHADPIQDEQLRQALLHSAKDRAENLMIVDLLRNDLSIYAQTGSVQVPKLFEVESFAQVHHLVSEIKATLKPDASPLDVLFAALPGGSITGAPKIRAMQIIDELEAQARGAYCGSMGYLNYDGTGRFNILIRSLQKHGDMLTAWAGGGITVASDGEEEYQECLDKIGAILNCVNGLSV
ncbi:aminodeoxychorismate synthase component I [Alkanindiges sp. WGS2144]|uniref:aminodeoxychorismate synthase component I n=1 Tax=Alkanindiges sp. WGS2144 TaxID=3366808 RepID=UPI003751C160